MARTVSSVYFKVSELPVGALAGRIVGLDNERETHPLEFEGEVAPKITDFSETYGKLHRGSITAGDEAALFNAYLLRQLGKFEPDEDQAGVLDYLFGQAGRGNVCNNGVDYNNGDGEAKRPNDSYRSVLWVNEPDGFELSDDVWVPKGGESKPKVIPASGYVGRTQDGAYDPDGAPFETWNSRELAEQTWTSAGFTPEFASMAVSYFRSRNEGEGTAVVVRWYWVGDLGRFFLDADWYPDYRYPYVGRLSASRSASGASHAPEQGE